MTNPIVKSISLADGRTITLETGKLAKQADGAVTLRMGDTMLLATVTAAKDASPGIDFMPLQVEYREKFSAFGRYPGGFMKREGRPSDHEILTSRLVDRVLRPLFPEDYHADVFVNITLYSSDGENIPDALAGLAASAALAVSDIPFNGPISEARVSRINGKFVVNPTFSQNEEADMDIIVGATMDNIMMVEGEMDEVSEEEFLGAIKIAHEAIKEQCQAQMELMEACDTVKKREYSHDEKDEELRKDVWDKCYQKAYEVATSQNTDKHARFEAFESIQNEYLESIEDEEERKEKSSLISRYYQEVEKEAMRRSILDEGKRLDGRATTQIRPIWTEIDYLPGAHGSAIFTRGETQSLTTVTLGTKLDEKIIDDVLNRGKDRFLLHYNFPPFSTGDARPQRGTSRREVGHGNLAHRALKRMIPDDYPYVIRVVSDILESNGSSSMATVCGATLAFMDAGVKIEKPVSGIAMGLISESKGEEYAVLSDILGDEDHLGDMDFKICGTADGITAAQMDIKVDGLPYEILENALSQAREGRLHILDHMLSTIAEPRPDLKPHAPRIEVMDIPKDLIGAIIGPGGKIIQGIQEETGAIITIEEEEDRGHIQVSATNKESIDAAMEKIRGIVAIPEVDEVYEATVRSVMPYGLFCEFLPGKDGLLHISEIDWKRIENIEDAGFKEGDKITIKLVDIDSRTGKFKLSRKALTERPNER
ncbi:MAG TPA: polyribonucleotide nucleotidyltransferase [Dysgonamonadaceae bacterium]|nr:polyribonucleotide nucleotidyltransferase [Dysgonamonadaceae bacterium]